MTTTTLDQIDPGHGAEIVRVRAAGGALNRRIVDTGLTRGSTARTREDT